MNKTVLNIIRFVVLVVAQILIVNHIRLGGYVHPYIYLIFVMLLPINTPGWQLLLAGFGIGLVMAFCRPSIVRLVSGSMKMEMNREPRIDQLGFPWYVRYTFCMVLVHNFTYFMMEGFSFHLVGQALLRILISVPVSMFLIITIMYLFSHGNKK